MTSNPQLTIVGGGIAGLATALALGQRGYDVRVLERKPDFAELGAGLQLAPNALSALDQLGVLDEALAGAVRPRALVLLDILNASRLKTVELGKRFEERFGYPYVVTHRSDLLGALLRACQRLPNISLETDKSLVDIKDLGDRVHIVCADGSTYEAEGVIAADGLWSRVRELVFPGGSGVQTPGYVAYRGTLPVSKVAANSVSDELLIWAGPDMHLVQYPVRGGEVYNQVAVFKTQPGHPDDQSWGNPQQLIEHFSRACPQVQSAVEQISRDRRWPLFDRDPIVTWARNRIVLTGDAAHPMLQFLAQGACQALEDAVAMASWVERLYPDYPKAFVAFQNSRVLRATQVQITARFFEHFWHPSGAAAQLRNEYLATHSANRYDEFDWLYGSAAPNGGPASRAINRAKESLGTT